MWIRRFGIDGLRLDAADCMDVEFLRALAAHARGLRPDFWLVGEAVHGDYRRWAGNGALDSITNYEVFKGLYSSHVDANYFEIAYSLNRQFGEAGLYRGLPLYNFADNHDVNRVASLLKKSGHLYPLYCLLFTIPGVPSIYYGSEWGLRGERLPDSDIPLRPTLDLAEAARTAPESRLPDAIARLARVRMASAALRLGGYAPLDTRHEQLAFLRRAEGEACVVAVNASENPAAMEFAVPGAEGARLVDLLNPGDVFEMRGGTLRLDSVPPMWARVLRIERG
jgi:glycosidase